MQLSIFNLPAFPQVRLPSLGGNPPFREILRFAQNDVFFFNALAQPDSNHRPNRLMKIFL